MIQGLLLWEWRPAGADEVFYLIIMNYRELPEGYRFAGTMDFTRNRKQVVAMLKLAVALVVIPLVLGALWHITRLRPTPAPRFSETWYVWPAMLGMLVAYIPLHELTHGAVMYALSGVRPSFGIRLPYAYCGSTAWFDRISHNVTALAPVVVWGIVLQILIAVLPREWFWPLWITQISNLSGSAGDIYCVWHLSRMKGDLLIRDDGTRMRIMRKIEK